MKGHTYIHTYIHKLYVCMYVCMSFHVVCPFIARELSFEWSHHRILLADSKVRVTLQNSIKYSGSERVNKIFDPFSHMKLEAKQSIGAIPFQSISPVLASTQAFLGKLVFRPSPQTPAQLRTTFVSRCFIRVVSDQSTVLQ